MRYIRFLKSPRFEGETIKALATITSDLGEDHMHIECDLIPVLTIYTRDHDSDDEKREDITLPTRRWSATSRAVPITYVPSREILDDVQSSFTLAVFAVDVRTGAKTWINRLPGGGGGRRRADADFPLVLSLVTSGFTRDAGMSSDKTQRAFEIADGSRLTIWEKPGDSIEGHIWDAGVAMMGFFNHMLAARLRHESGKEFVQTESPRRMSPLTVLELGCGTGLVGLFLASIVPCCSVTLTDLPAAKELVTFNIAESLRRPATESSARFAVLEWGQIPLPDSIVADERGWDLVIASDVNYNPDNAEALVGTISAIQKQSTSDVLIFVASKQRHESESIFAALMSQDGFAIHNQFSVVLPTDDNASAASMWPAQNRAAEGQQEDIEAAANTMITGYVQFTLYMKKKNADEKEETKDQSKITGVGEAQTQTQARRDHMLSDLWVPNKQWSSSTAKRKKDSQAKAVAKAKRKRTGQPYDYGP